MGQSLQWVSVVVESEHVDANSVLPLPNVDLGELVSFSDVLYL